jgi:hypothetical protein
MYGQEIQAMMNATSVKAVRVIAEVITVSVRGGLWVADWSDTAMRQQIIGLFGSALVPTPFTFMRDGNEVIARLQALNPEYRVVLGK